MDCDRIRDDLGRREAGLLDAGAAEDLSRHLAACDGCRAFSARMRKLVAVLEEYPEVRQLPKRSGFRRLSRSRVAAIAAALLMAVLVPTIGPLVGPRTVLEGGFDVPSRGVVVARDSSSSLVAHDHRMRLRKGTRVRIVSASEVVLEEGRLDVSGLREGASGLKIGTPLGRIEVLGTQFVVEVTPVNKSQAAVAAGSFVVGVMVSSGVVSYGDHRLGAGQGIVDETGKAPRRVAADDLERRRRASAERERELETRLAALSVEKDRLGQDLAALGRGVAPAVRAPLTPGQRRDRVRRLAQVMVKSFFLSRAAVETPVPPLDEKELQRLVQEKGSVEIERTVSTRVEVDVKAMEEALRLADEVGMNFFTPTSFLTKPDVVEELMLAVLEANGTVAASVRPAVEAAVRSAYEPLQGPWESKLRKHVEEARAVQRALTQLESTLTPAQVAEVYHTARSIVSIPEYAVFPAGDPKWRAEWVDRMAKDIGLDAASRPFLDTAVDEMVGRIGKLPGRLGSDPKSDFDYTLRCREQGAELVRQLSARFPDLKDKIDFAVEPR